MPTPKLKGRVVIGLCLAGMLTCGCAPSEPPEVSSPQTERKSLKPFRWPPTRPRLSPQTSTM